MAGIAGKWNIVVHTFMGDQSSVHEYQVEGDTLTGTITDGSNGSQAAVQDGKVEGNKFSFKFVIKAAIGEMEFNMEGALQDDDTIKGASSNAMGSFEFDGTRV